MTQVEVGRGANGRWAGSGESVPLSEISGLCHALRAEAGTDERYKTTHGRPCGCGHGHGSSLLPAANAWLLPRPRVLVFVFVRGRGGGGGPSIKGGMLHAHVQRARACASI